MNEQEAIAALKAIGLRGEAHNTGHPEWTRVFAIDREGVTHGRLSFNLGQLTNVEWYLGNINFGPVGCHERIPWAWRLWTEQGELLTLERWAVTLGRAKAAAREERAAKQAWRDANPGPKRKRLELNVRKHLAARLLGEVL